MGQRRGLPRLEGHRRGAYRRYHDGGRELGFNTLLLLLFSSELAKAHGRISGLWIC